MFYPIPFVCVFECMTLQYVWAVISLQVILLGCFILTYPKYSSIAFSLKIFSLLLKALEEAWNDMVTESGGRG